MHFALIFLSMFTFASNEQKATKALAEATYRYTKLDKKVKYLEKRYLNEDLKEYGGYLAIITKLLEERKIICEWKF